jgi:hypothetical protein
MYKPGTTYNIPFEVKNAANALADPDAAAMPGAVLWYDAAPLGVTCTVTRLSTGLFAAAVPIPTSPTCVLGKTVKLRITATVGVGAGVQLPGPRRPLRPRGRAYLKADRRPLPDVCGRRRPDV